MELPQLLDLIRRSTLLSEDERNYWLTASATMRPEQLKKLEDILTQAESIPLKESIQRYFAAVRQSKNPLPA